MSLFESIKDAIFGHAVSGASTPTPVGTVPPKPSLSPSTAFVQPAGLPSAPPPVQQPVDVEAVLSGLAAKSPQRLNWQQSIVDLMKLLGLDSSLANRTALAKELGYTGDTADSAVMNIWLHKQVMTKLAQSGGKVPQSLQS
jgi:hypothetical protein